MKDDVLTDECRHILARLCPDGRTPMMRFVFLGWTHSDYESLDRRLGTAEIGTCRYVLPDDEGILVGSEGTYTSSSAANGFDRGRIDSRRSVG
jgi:hypothetical protein